MHKEGTSLRGIEAGKKGGAGELNESVPGSYEVHGKQMSTKIAT